MRTRKRKWILVAATIGLLLCAALVALAALSNFNLPARSRVPGSLSHLEQARLAEAIQLREALGDQVWDGWGRQEIPIIVYNEDYAFLIGYSDPPAGWLKMPQRIARGGAWQVVPDDTFEGQIYYRQPLPDPKSNPENFTVLVGTRWVATLATREYAQIDFYAGLKEQVPLPIRGIVPYPLVWRLLMGETEAYIGALEHEMFHAFQGTRAPARLGEAEQAVQYEKEYPWNDSALERNWKNETALLVRAVRAPSNPEALDLARQFLEQRAARRVSSRLTVDMVDYERHREWLEGLAKYAELTIGKAASNSPSYTPVPAMSADSEFHAYRTGEQVWSQQLDEALRTEGRSGETRFYYSGMAQAALLDRLLPGWKRRAFDRDVFLEDLVQQAVVQP